MLKAHRALALAIIAVLAMAGAVHAQSPLGVGSAEPAFSVGGPLGPFFAWINSHQQSFYRALTGALRAMREDPWALSGLIGLSFAYGVFHAAGPGHGKAVISSYMIANEIARWVGLSLLAAGLIFVLFVLTVWVVIGRSLRPVAALRDTLRALPEVQACLQDDQGSLLLAQTLQDLAVPHGCLDLLVRAVAEEPATVVRDGGVIARGFDAEPMRVGCIEEAWPATEDGRPRIASAVDRTRDDEGQLRVELAVLVDQVIAQQQGHRALALEQLAQCAPGSRITIGQLGQRRVSGGLGVQRMPDRRRCWRGVRGRLRLRRCAGAGGG